MKRYLAGAFLALVSMAAFGTTASGILWNGAAPDPTSLTNFLSNPTFQTVTVSASPSIFTTPKLKDSNINIGPTALTSIGTNTTDVNGQLWVSDIFIPISRSITTIGFLQGGTATTDKCLVAIYNAAGTLLGNSATAGVTLSGANTFQEQALTASVALTGPGTYFVALQCNGTAAGAFQILASPNIMNRSSVVSGTFGTVPATITPPTSWTTGQAPVVYVY
jgi:hypothetical protein